MFSRQALLPISPGAAAAARAPIQTKLRVGAVNDPLEHEADRAADAVLRGERPAIAGSANGQAQRKCDACAEDEEGKKAVRLKRRGSKAANVPAITSLPSSAFAGSPLSAEQRAYFEPRFGREFSGVRIADGPEAHASSDALGARAFTLGSTIAFARGEYRPETADGRRLLAHELTHVLQQRHGRDQQAIRRTVRVDKPGDKIPNPTGTGLVQTNATTIQDYLRKLCPGGKATVGAAGDVSLTTDFCKVPALPSLVAGPTASPAQLSSTSTGCTCLCDMISSAHAWTIEVDDVNWPGTRFVDDKAAETAGSGGTGGKVTAPSPNSPKAWGAATVSGKTLDIEPWLVLGHELCGHAWMGDQGAHGPDTTKVRGSGGHQATVARENLIRAEHGIEARGSWRDPYCGESYFRKGATGAPEWGKEYRNECLRWRREYNAKRGTKYRIEDAVPP